MRITAKLIIAMFMLFSLLHCRHPADRMEADVSWELLSNTHSDLPRARAEFTIRNNFGFRLTDKNWALYYSQTPRNIISTDPLALAEVEWINGDWHRIVPSEGFELRRGGEARINYEVSAWWIKESDAPMGLYYIFYDDNGNETDTVVVENYVIKPFVREEQVSRHLNDHTPIPTPEWQFEENQNMSLVAPAQLKRIIPTPFSIKSTGDIISFTEPVEIFYQPGLENEARYLARLLSGLAGQAIQPREGTDERANSILLTRSDFIVNGIGSEAYRLDIRTNRNIVINGTDEAGVFYGIQTLMSLLPVNSFAGAVDAVTLEAMTVEDAPRFPYRGIHIDVARNFQEKETILHILDLMAFYKINTLHFHLTEDEGWRIEIGELPELTRVGGQREHTTKEAPAVHPAYGSGPFPYAEGTYGSGYYTREDYIEILRYARERHITVIPEVNVPGHSRAAIKAMEARYNRLMAEGDEEAANEYRLIDPEETSVYLSAQSFTDNVINVARESAYRFFETVVDAIIDMYREAEAPLEIFHTGGDEVPAGAWTQSPMADELLEKLPGITEPRNLQAYFFERAIGILRERGLKVAGWEEVALLWDEAGEYVPNPQFADGTVIPYMWNSLWGHQDLAYRLANLGYPVVLCHVSNFYFDLAYNKDPREPGHTWAGFVNTRDAWYYAPFDMFKTTIRDNMGREIDIDTEYAGMERIRPEARDRVLGIQAQLWSETILGRDMLEYYMLPKMIGLAESAWAAQRSFETIDDRGRREDEAQRKWNIFANTLAQKELPRLAVLHGGYNYRIPPPGAIIDNNLLRANTEFPGLAIRYTTDDQDPSMNSELYTGPVELTGPIRVRAFDSAGRGSRTVIVE